MAWCLQEAEGLRANLVHQRLFFARHIAGERVQLLKLDSDSEDSNVVRRRAVFTARIVEVIGGYNS